MTVESADDRATLLADFGESVVFSPKSTYPSRNDATETITAIFDKDYVEISTDEIGVDSKAPALLCRSADVTDAEINSMCEIGVDRYKVVGVEHDGTGIAVLILEGPK